MADNGRKNFSTQMAEKLTPDAQKTVGEQVKEAVTGNVDRLKAAVTPNAQKSIPQQLADKIRGEPQHH